MSGEKKRVLMVCLGNICRSPMAEAVFRRIVKDQNLEDKWEVDSAAIIGYHTGKSPDPRTIGVLKEEGITDYKHKARTVKKSDFLEFDYIFGMDKENIKDLKSQVPENSKASIELLGSYDPEGGDIIRDPYYDNGDYGFVECYAKCERSCLAFLMRKTNEEK
ncbi:unnamed protein product [Trichogramma brassicae]|uniref:Low molecular weight phosphotyrosine protein phosphatase n=2 Tax=Trichogramma TaxID=7490 RepID=A0A6H5IXW9_9HYME|nr:low molecular weight phosphotyrosine protein phosphatase-like [Trichogramma pretiosum]CAB0042402.1 unnamed protein product [Trichogramma brassicae]